MKKIVLFLSVWFGVFLGAVSYSQENSISSQPVNPDSHVIPFNPVVNANDLVNIINPDNPVVNVNDSVNSGNPVKALNQSTLFGIGKSFLNDTYLSPLRYSGITMSLMHERIKGTSLFNNKLLLQQQFLIQVAFTKNPSASAKEYYGNIHYQITGFYPLYAASGFRLFGGGGWEASLGGIYNMRNSNNPGSLKVSTNFNLSAMAIYNWKIFTFRWQLTTPFAGLFFSPEYGHSYYEIFTLGNDKGTIHFGSFHNQRALQNYFSVDVPVRNITFRAAYMGEYYNTKANELITKIISHQFMIGLAYESFNFGGKKVRNNPSFPSVYY